MNGKKSSNRSKQSRAAADRSQLRKRLIWIGGIVVVLGGAVFIAADVAQPEAPPPPELEATETFEELDPVHLAPGSPTPEYNSDPPTSGPHDPSPAPCGIYREPVSDQGWLHSLEHGAVFVQYDPSLPETDIEAVEDMVRSNGREILLAPRPGIPAPYALGAWTRLLLVDEIDQNLVDSFEREFGNRFSPEPGAVCPFAIDQS
ncbi:MAG: DUF3105 domain-containing protein [Acidimicrobiia bacterium]